MPTQGSLAAAIWSGTLVAVANNCERQRTLVAGRPARIVAGGSELSRCLLGPVESLSEFGDRM